MDIAPPWYELGRRGCSGETRGCSGGDEACHAQAEKDGYVAISLYSFCRRDQVRTEPTASGVMLIAALGVVAAGGALVAWKRRKRA
jgi:hypothetical protein